MVRSLLSEGGLDVCVHALRLDWLRLDVPRWIKLCGAGFSGDDEQKSTEGKSIFCKPRECQRNS
jgi:hypothetical protein